MTRLLVVYYDDPPTPDWDKIVAQKAAHPGTDMWVIIDPTSSGAGSVIAAQFTDVIRRLRAVGCKFLGYVWTNYGARVGLGAKADITNYATWYGLDGVFFDGTRSTPGSEAQYAVLATLSRSLGMSEVVGNPGTQLSGANYGSTFDALITWENSGYPQDLSQSYIAEGVPFNAAKIAASTGKYLYAAEGDYLHLPSYFGQLVAALDSGGIQPPPPPDTVDIPPGKTKIQFL